METDCDKILQELAENLQDVDVDRDWCRGYLLALLNRKLINLNVYWNVIDEIDKKGTDWNQ